MVVRASPATEFLNESMTTRKDSRGKLRTAAKVVLFNLLFLLVLVEAVGLVAYGWRTGALYYTHETEIRRVAPTLYEVVESYRIHPYLGFIIRPSGSVAANDGAHRYNDLGFDSPWDYPLARREGEVLVGITGGSAAAHLAVFEHREKILARALAEPLGLAGPDQVRVLNLAQGGYKEPQQLLIYDYLRSLGQELDLLVTFDGFNEVALGARNALAGVAIDMPSIEHVRALQEVTTMSGTSSGLEAMLEVRRNWGRYAAMYNRTWSGEAWEARFAGGFLVDYLLYKYYYRRYLKGRASAVDLDQPSESGRPSWLYLNPLRRDAPRAAGGVDLPPEHDGEALDQALAQAITLWARSTRQLARAVEADGGVTLHVIQPNQYHATGRQFDDEERRVALSPLSPYRQPIAAGYPRLAQAAEILASEGLPVHAPLTLLDDIPEPVYIDDCCHFTDVGQRVLLGYIAELAVERMGAGGAGSRPARGGADTAIHRGGEPSFPGQVFSR